MPAVKLNISLDRAVAEKLRRRSAELRKPASRYLAELIEEEERRSQDELAGEGYRVLSPDTANFAARAWPLAAEVWPEWTDETAPRSKGGVKQQEAANGKAGKTGRAGKRR